MRLRPSLASQAPKVSITILREGNGILVIVRDIGIKATSVSIMPSKEKRDIKK